MGDVVDHSFNINFGKQAEKSLASKKLISSFGNQQNSIHERLNENKSSHSADGSKSCKNSNNASGKVGGAAAVNIRLAHKLNPIELFQDYMSCMSEN